jgi:DNA-directed RNA polymerase subunit H
MPVAPKIDILGHQLVPEHTILKKEEERELLRRLGIEKTQLPWLKSSDPAAKAIGAKPGNIVKVERKSLTAGEALMFRCVVPG